MGITTYSARNQNTFVGFLSFAKKAVTLLTLQILPFVEDDCADIRVQHPVSPENIRGGIRSECNTKTPDRGPRIISPGTPGNYSSQEAFRQWRLPCTTTIFRGYSNGNYRLFLRRWEDIGEHKPDHQMKLGVRCVKYITNTRTDTIRTGIRCGTARYGKPHMCGGVFITVRIKIFFVLRCIPLKLPVMLYSRISQPGPGGLLFSQPHRLCFRSTIPAVHGASPPRAG